CQMTGLANDIEDKLLLDAFETLCRDPSLQGLTLTLTVSRFGRQIYDGPTDWPKIAQSVSLGLKDLVLELRSLDSIALKATEDLSSHLPPKRGAPQPTPGEA